MGGYLGFLIWVILLGFIEIIERNIGKFAKKEFVPVQPSDLHRTFSDSEDLFSDVDFKPQTSFNEGIRKFISWCKKFYKK